MATSQVDYSKIREEQRKLGCPLGGKKGPKLDYTNVGLLSRCPHRTLYLRSPIVMPHTSKYSLVNTEENYTKTKHNIRQLLTCGHQVS